MPRILILDEHFIFRAGLRILIEAKVPRAEVIEASGLIQALSQIQDEAVDLVLLGLELSSFGQLNILKAAREALPAARFAIISAADTRAAILASIAAGFHGFISKNQSDASVVAAITDILFGRTYLPLSLTEAKDRDALDGRLVSGEEVHMLLNEVDLPKLTKRQIEVLSLLAGGMSNKEIARVLNIAEATTKIHMAALCRALGVRNRTEAAFKAGSAFFSPGKAEVSSYPHGNCLSKAAIWGR